MSETRDFEENKRLMYLENGSSFKPQNNTSVLDPRTSQTNTNMHEKHLDDYMRLEKELRGLRRKFHGLAVIVVVGIIILIVIMSGLYGRLSHVLKTHTHKPNLEEQIAKILQEEPLCVTCDDIRLGPSPQENQLLDGFKRKYKNGKEQCCIETPGQLLDMIELSIERRYREELARGNIKMHSSSEDSTPETRPAAHLLGSLRLPKLPRIPGSQFPISEWIHKEDIAFTNNLIYRNGRLVVPQTGLYFVYSQISFFEVFGHLKQATLLGAGSHSLSHYLYRYNIIYRQGGEEVLAQNSITKCWNLEKSFGEYTSYLGAVFFLRQGDEVFVKVSNLTMVSRDHKQNYFGMFQL